MVFILIEVIPVSEQDIIKFRNFRKILYIYIYIHLYSFRYIYIYIHLIVFSLEGRAWQEPEPSHVTDMTLAHCNLGKFLGIVCPCFPPPLDVPTLAARLVRPQQRERS